MTLEVTSANVFGVLNSGASPDSHISFANTFAVYNFPAEAVQNSQSLVRCVLTPANNVAVSKAVLFAIVRGRAYNPKLRTWTFTLDGHDFYVIRLSEDKTLVFDVSTRQWSWFNTDGQANWRTTTGLNWRSAGKVSRQFGSNVIVGDDTFGILWVLDPNKQFDDNTSFTENTPIRFERIATAQVTTRGNKNLPCFEVYLSSDTSAPALVGSSVTLEYSDDEGRNYVNAGTLPVTGAGHEEFVWRSLGLIRAPGRLFRVRDNGAFARINSLDIENGG